MKKISTHPQEGQLVMRYSGAGEVGIMIATENPKKLKNAIWWNCKEELLYDLKKIISILEAEE